MRDDGAPSHDDVDQRLAVLGVAHAANGDQCAGSAGPSDVSATSCADRGRTTARDARKRIRPESRLTASNVCVSSRVSTAAVRRRIG